MYFKIIFLEIFLIKEFKVEKLIYKRMVWNIVLIFDMCEMKYKLEEKIVIENI